MLWEVYSGGITSQLLMKGICEKFDVYSVRHYPLKNDISWERFDGCNNVGYYRLQLNRNSLMDRMSPDWEETPDWVNIMASPSSPN